MPPPLGLPSGQSPSSPAAEASAWQRLLHRPNPFEQNNFNGRDILVVYNPNAQQGRFSREQPALENVLRGMGFQPHFLKTDPDPVRRLDLIGQEAGRLFSASQRPVYIYGVGGDTTVDEVVRAATERVVGPLHEVRADQNASALLRTKMAGQVVTNTGTAGDIPAQLNAPPHWLGLRTLVSQRLGLRPPEVFREFPAFLANSQELPMGIASIRSDVAHPVGTQSAFHSVNFGAGGYVFELGERNREAGPTLLRNRGIFNYFRVTPQAIKACGMRGWIVEIEHKGQIHRFRAGDVLGSTNRIITGAAGLPGAWGEFKLTVIPNGTAGIVPLLEGIGRGLATKAGWNLISARHRLRSLPAENQIIIRPGERAIVRFFDVDTNEPVRVPWQVNGAAVSRLEELQPGAEKRRRVYEYTHQAEIYVSPFTVPVRSDPEGFGMLLYHQDALSSGRPITYRKNDGSHGAVTPYYPREALRALAARLNIEPSHIPNLIAKAHGVNSPAEFARFETHSLSMNDLESWARSPEGAAFNRRIYRGPSPLAPAQDLMGDRLENRLAIHAPGFLLGALTMHGADRLMRRWGVDPNQDPFLHFAGSAILSHGVHQTAGATYGILMNRWKSLPYDVAFSETATLAGQTSTRYIYENSPGLLQSARRASMRSLGFQMGRSSLLLRGAQSVFTVPSRMAWGMGPGLASSRMIGSMLEGSDISPEARQNLVAAAFYMPNLNPIISGNRGLALGEGALMRGVNGAFSLGFIADMAFTGLHSLAYGDHAAEMRWSYHAVSAERERRYNRGFFSAHGITSFFAPELAAWLDSD